MLGSTIFSPSLGTFEIVALIVIPTIVICILVVMGYFCYYQNKRGMHHHLGPGEDSIEAPDHPILSGVSLKHMIEMTTSGSGSGKVTFNCYYNY